MNHKTLTLVTAIGRVLRARVLARPSTTQNYVCSLLHNVPVCLLTMLAALRLALTEINAHLSVIPTVVAAPYATLVSLVLRALTRLTVHGARASARSSARTTLCATTKQEHAPTTWMGAFRTTTVPLMTNFAAKVEVASIFFKRA